MELTGKCKEEFENWFEPEPEDKKDVWANVLHGSMILEFNTLKESMKYGVLVDYFDSVGIIIGIVHDYESWSYILENYLNPLMNFDTRQEARIKAIEKANEFRNQELNV